MAELEVRELRKRFGGVLALDGVTLHVERGEIHGLIGPNGSGKSTCINVISGLYRPSGGTIRFHGTSIGRLAPYRITRAGIARTFQNIRLFKQLSVVENVMIAVETHASYPVVACLWRGPRVRRHEQEARSEAERVLALVGLEGVAERTADSLPYGKQRALEVARAVAGRPKLLLLDEPAAGLNDEETGALAQMIRRLQSDGITLLLIEHKMSLVMAVCDRVTVLDFGRVIAEGLPEEIRTNEQVIEAYLGRAKAAGEVTPFPS